MEDDRKGRRPEDGASGGEHSDGRAENFRLHIRDDGLFDDGAELSSEEKGDSPGERDVLHSYSSPRTRQALEAEQLRAKKEAERAHRVRSREKGRKNRRLFRVVWVSMVVILGLAVGQYLVSGFGDMLAVNRNKVSVTVEIPKNASTEKIADILYANGVIEKRDFFRIYSKMTKADGSYTQGTFHIDTDLDYEAIINYLQSEANRVDTVKITFQEGLNLRETAELLEKNGVCTAEDVLKAASSKDFENYDLVSAVTNDKDRYYLLEGYLFPDTYDFYKNEDPKQALGKMINNCSKKMTQSIREQAQKQGMSLDQVLNLASIIQAESADKEDMKKVSSVLQNRLKNGAKTGTLQLGCDSTVYYPYRQKTQVPEKERETYVSRYDTYQITGLPPGPICNPGLDAINAALNPADTDYYYFCHSKDGKAYYAKTAAQHKKNLKKAGLTQ